MDIWHLLPPRIFHVLNERVQLLDARCWTDDVHSHNDTSFEIVNVIVPGVEGTLYEL